jgi:hypothetical protein
MRFLALVFVFFFNESAPKEVSKEMPQQKKPTV